MTSIYSWSKSAGDNGSADSGINFAENQLPSTVNNSCRQLMGRVAEFLEDIAGDAAVSGSSNAYTVTTESNPGSWQNGYIFSFIANHTITGAATVNVNTWGSKSLRAKSATDLNQGEIEENTLVIAIYFSATDECLIVNHGRYSNSLGISINSLTELASPSTNDEFIFYNQTATSNRKIRFSSLSARLRPGMIGEIKAWPGLEAPSGDTWSSLFCFGQAVDRTDYSALFGVLTSDTTAQTALGSFDLTNVAALPAGVGSGTPIEGDNIPVGTTISSVTGSGPYTITMSQNATASSSSGVVRYLPYGGGDGSTTFNLPDFRGFVPAGRDDMGGTAANRLTSGTSGIDTDRLGATGGDENMQQHTHNVPNLFERNIQDTGSGVNMAQAYTSGFELTYPTNSTGTGQSENVQPTAIVNYIIIAT